MSQKIRGVLAYFTKWWRLALGLLSVLAFAIAGASLVEAIGLIIGVGALLALIALTGSRVDTTHDDFRNFQQTNLANQKMIEELRASSRLLDDRTMTLLQKEAQLRNQVAAQEGDLQSRITTQGDDLRSQIAIQGGRHQAQIAALHQRAALNDSYSARQNESSERIRRGQSLVTKAIARHPPAVNEASPPPQERFALPTASPQVTVVVPNYNDSAYIEATLRSVQQQTFTDFECIIVDDASTDDSVSIAQAFVRDDDRFKLVRHQANGGLSASRNTGLRLAAAPMVAFLDSDDLFLANNLNERVGHLIGISDASIAGVFSGVEQRNEDIRLEGLPAEAKWGDPGIKDFLTTRGECPFNCHAPLLRTDVLRAFGGFRESMKQGAEDWDLWLRLMRNGYRFVPTPHILAIYRQKARSMVRALPAEHLRESRAILESVQQAGLPTDQVPNSPFWFGQPLAHYQTELDMAQRAFQYLGLAAFAEGEDQFARALDAIDPEVLPIIARAFEPEAEVVSGIRRAVGLEANELREIRAHVDQLATQIVTQVHSAIRPPCDPIAVADSSHADFLFVPRDTSQARQMLRSAQTVDGARSEFLLLERESGGTGTADLLSANGVRTATLNEWLLHDRAHRTLVVAPPYGHVVSELVRRNEELGGRTVALSANEVLELPDAPQPNATLISPSGLRSDAGHLPVVFGTNQESSAPTTGCLAAVDAMLEEYPHLTWDAADLQRFKDQHAGERCVIIGNGPSLNKLDLSLLADETTFEVNGIFYAADKMGFDPSYYVVEDSSVMKENIEQIKTYQAGHKFFPNIYRSIYGEGSDVSYFMMNRGFYAAESPNYCVPRFSTDAAQRLFCGQSVTIINLQLAYYMGFTEVILIGMDFSYVIPDSAERNGDVLTSAEDDPNHFHPDYFGKGKTWKDPKLDRVLANYALAKEIFEADGRRIINATAGGNLNMFDRIDYHELFGSQAGTARSNERDVADV